MLVLRGQGLPRLGKEGARGHHYVTINIDIPHGHLDDKPPASTAGDGDPGTPGSSFGVDGKHITNASTLTPSQIAVLYRLRELSPNKRNSSWTSNSPGSFAAG